MLFNIPAIEEEYPHGLDESKIIIHKDDAELDDTYCSPIYSLTIYMNKKTMRSYHVSLKAAAYYLRTAMIQENRRRLEVAVKIGAVHHKNTGLMKSDNQLAEVHANTLMSVAGSNPNYEQTFDYMISSQALHNYHEEKMNKEIDKLRGDEQ